jgi:hypothetical protein
MLWERIILSFPGLSLKYSAFYQVNLDTFYGRVVIRYNYAIAM